VIELIEDFQKMPHRSRHPIESPNEHDIEFVPGGISQSIDRGQGVSA
jgi:hypothetical protein